jgi:hypothetical protein
MKMEPSPRIEAKQQKCVPRKRDASKGCAFEEEWAATA